MFIYNKSNLIKPVQLVFCFTVFIFSLSVSHAAQTLDEAINSQLGNGCEGLLGVVVDGDNIIPPPTIGSELTSICNAIGSGTPLSTGGGSGTTQVASTILKRLRKNKSDDNENKEEGAASSDISFKLMTGFDVFLSTSYESLDRQTTFFESGYDSDIWNITAGVDVDLTSWIRGGIAFNFNQWNADFLSTGGFETNSYGPVLFASFYPSDQFYVDIVLNYAHKDYKRDRFATFSAPSLLASGNVSSESDGDELGAMFSSGYDFNFGNITIGPRVGFQYSHLALDSYTEQGSTGLELKYDDYTVESLRTTLGIRGSAAFSTNFGVLIPEINAEWVHEFMNDQQDIVVQFAQDLRADPSKFSYNNERPDRDFFHIGAGLSIILANGIQPYINFQALVGHNYYTNYVGTIGGRFEF